MAILQIILTIYYLLLFTGILGVLVFMARSSSQYNQKVGLNLLDVSQKNAESAHIAASAALKASEAAFKAVETLQALVEAKKHDAV